jgi:hypothetical protein
MSKALIALFIILSAVHCEEVPQEEGVLVLSESNFDEVIKNN